MNNQTFEIGLVGAGAISAGAYTAGVIDFLIYALDLWYEAKEKSRNIPTHDVKLSVFSGASAGGITAALGAAYMSADQLSISDEKDAISKKGTNILFDSWVDRIDISSLLESRDLEDKNSKVTSLLDSSILGEIADSGLNVTPRKQKRHYIAEKFNLILTLTNLRGVPYSFKVSGNEIRNYGMSLHADHVHFRIEDSTPSQTYPHLYSMSWKDFGDIHSPIKEKLKQSALASSAFPIGLVPRLLSHQITLNNLQKDWYSSRSWPIPTPHSKPHQCTTFETIDADWGITNHGEDVSYQYNFQCVDGGVMNNEPLELARQVLAGSTGRNEREGKFANKAILLIDPFPSSPFNLKHTSSPDLLTTAMDLFAALKNQARFKPEELMLAAKEDIYSRFMIAPTRGGEAYPIACGSLGGFGGFLKRDFRLHDYFLGRYNTQKFLKDHFVLPESNPLFTNWNDQVSRNAYYARNANGEFKTDNGEKLLPVIPLVGEARSRICYKTEWPQYTDQDLSRLMKQLDNRIDILLDRLINQYFQANTRFSRFLTKLMLSRKKKDVVKFIEQKIVADLEQMKLMR